MTDDPLTISMNEDLETCMALMRRHSFRHLPVCHEGQLVGMVSLRDILLHDLNEKDDEVRMMRAYIHSMPDAPFSHSRSRPVSHSAEQESAACPPCRCPTR